MLVRYPFASSNYCCVSCINSKVLWPSSPHICFKEDKDGTYLFSDKNYCHLRNGRFIELYCTITNNRCTARLSIWSLGVPVDIVCNNGQSICTLFELFLFPRFMTHSFNFPAVLVDLIKLRKRKGRRQTTKWLFSWCQPGIGKVFLASFRFEWWRGGRSFLNHLLLMLHKNELLLKFHGANGNSALPANTIKSLPNISSFAGKYSVW